GFYLQSDGALRCGRPSSDVPPRSYTFDPEHPVPTVGGSLCGVMELPPETGDLDPMWRRFLSPVARLRHIVTTGPAHQKEGPQVFGAQPPYPLLADRPDVLVFRTPPLPAPVEVTRHGYVKLWTSSSGGDPDFTAQPIHRY